MGWSEAHMRSSYYGDPKVFQTEAPPPPAHCRASESFYLWLLSAVFDLLILCEPTRVR